MSRKNNLHVWYQQTDMVSLLLLFTIMLLGILLIATASTPIAEKLGLDSFHFVKRQLVYMTLAIFIIMFLTAVSEKTIRRLSLIGFIVSVAFLIILIFVGGEAKGARRWISIFGFSFQPSEFIKPFYTIIISIVLSQKRKANSNINQFLTCIALNAFIIVLLMLQPDFGMAMTITLVTATQLFISGLRIFWLLIILITVIFLSFCAYFMFPHVASRVDKFLSSSNKVNYQVEKSLESYVSGGFTGKGPGEGNLKFVLPDSHTDFIFAVAGEEFGTLFCILIIGLFTFFIIRGLLRLTSLNNLFYIYSCFGFLMYYSIQVIFNVGVTLNLFPTKGMTLPFISYGGSSILSCSIAAGFLLNFTKKDPKKTHNMKKRFIYVNH